ncbi:THAP domain-containing protein 5-like [Gastrophryne carolinensis]
MPKSCVAPECRRTEGPGESYYKFPLHDRVRLKQWLANMNMENFFPAKNHYLCSKHFKLSCFQVRWGVRYLKHDAVPTIFSFTGIYNKAHAAKTKILKPVQNVNNELNLAAITPVAIDSVPIQSETLTFALDPAFTTGQMCINGREVLLTDPTTLAIPSTMVGAVNLVPLVHIVESFDGLSLALAPSQGFTSVALPIEMTVQQENQEIPLVEPVTILSEEHIASTTLQNDYYDNQVLQSVEGGGATTFIEVNEAPEDVTIEPFFEAGLPTPEAVTMSQEEVTSYLETIQTATVVPALETGPLPPLMSSPDTVLSASVTRPISSTVPIVSQHGEEVMAEAILTDQVSSDPAQGPDGVTETLTTAELVSVVLNLQKKMQALQQRHQTHCSKLEVMEGVVEQLKKENLISEDNLKFLEIACLNSTPAASEDGETIAIVCEEDSQPLVYTIPFQNENRTVFHIQNTTE